MDTEQIGLLITNKNYQAICNGRIIQNIKRLQFNRQVVDDISVFIFEFVSSQSFFVTNNFKIGISIDDYRIFNVSNDILIEHKNKIENVKKYLNVIADLNHVIVKSE